jgi:hypothetical protein
LLGSAIASPRPFNSTASRSKLHCSATTTARFRPASGQRSHVKQKPPISTTSDTPTPGAPSTTSPPHPPGFRRRAFSSISGDDNTTIFRSPGACLLEGSVDPLQPMRCTVFRPAVVSTASRWRGRRHLPPCRSCCSYLVYGPSCNLVLFGGPFCKLSA